MGCSTKRSQDKWYETDTWEKPSDKSLYICLFEPELGSVRAMGRSHPIFNYAEAIRDHHIILTCAEF